MLVRALCRIEARARVGQEGAVAGAAVEGKTIFEDLPDRRFRHRDREPLVVVAVPFDVGFEEDRPADAAEHPETEERRFARVRNEVVDRSGDRRRRDPECGGGHGAGADLSRRGTGFGFEAAEIALRRRLWVDAEPDRQVDADVFEDAHRFFRCDDRYQGFVLDGELREADLRVAGRRSEELVVGRGGAGRHVGGADACLPAVGGGVRVVLGGDDVAGVGERGSGRRRDRGQHEQRSRQSALRNESFGHPISLFPGQTWPGLDIYLEQALPDIGCNNP